MADAALVELYIERPKRSVVGNVYWGKVSDVLPGMQAAFVDIGLEKNAFLYVDEVVDKLINPARWAEEAQGSPSEGKPTQ